MCAASLGVGFTPAGTLADICTAAAGKDCITGDKVGGFWRFAGIVPFVSELRKVGKALEVAGEARRFPGRDPSVAPDGFEWRGQPGSTPGSKSGNYYNPNTGETLRPDLNHMPPVGPHWDYKDSSGNWFRMFEDGRVVPK